MLASIYASYNCGNFRDTSWNLTEYIQNLKITLKTWRRVYWRLWSQTHFLECSSCSMPFAATDFMKCLFHPESSHYMGTTRNKGNFQPIGKYSCCQQQVLRFATVPNHHVILPLSLIEFINSMKSHLSIFGD
jgi:hypothetical protein